MVDVEGFVIQVPQVIYADMREHVAAGYPNEACGALGAKDNRVVKHYPTTNAAEHPDDFSIIDPTDLLHIYEDIDEYDGEMIYYHSHPKSEAFRPKETRNGQTQQTLLHYLFSPVLP